MEANSSISSVEENKGGIDFTVLPAVTQMEFSSAINFTNEILRSVRNDKIDQIVSSPLKNASSRNDEEKLDCPLKPTASPRGESGNDKGELNNGSAEWAQIEKLVSSGIVPSTDRIKRCLMDFLPQWQFWASDG